MYYFKKDDWINNLIKYYEFNYAGWGILVFSAILITFYTNKRYINGLITLFFTTLVTWFGHYALHKFPNNPISKFHQYTHHSNFGKTLLGKILEYTINEVFFFGGGILFLIVLLIHHFTNTYILNPYIIIWWTISVPLVHEVYYHQSKTDNIHQLHHKDNLKSLGPDIWDIIFNTKHDNSPMEDETTIGIIMLIWCLLFVYLINLFKY